MAAVKMTNCVLMLTQAKCYSKLYSELLFSLNSEHCYNNNKQLLISKLIPRLV